MNIYGVIGFPLSHSFSKKYFTEKFQRENLSACSFENFELADISLLPDLLKNNPAIKGLSVTIPHKEKIISWLTETDEIVKQIGACNSVKISDGKLFGYNTDVYGFENSLTKYLKQQHASALILGRGGAAKAVAYVLDKLNITYSFVERIAKDDSLCYEEVDAKIIAENLLIINTTPVGMFPKIAECPQIDYEAITPQHYLFDLTYNPEKPLFLQKGEAYGAAIQNGYDMLVLQAEKSWELWNS